MLQTFYRTPKVNEQNLGEHGFAFRHTAIPKAQFRKKWIKSDFVKIDLCSVKNMVNISKRESIDWEEKLVICKDTILWSSGYGREE
jgi:hypothetical protein